MPRLVLLAAVSGAGKSTGLKPLEPLGVSVVELDRLIKQLYTQLSVGGPVAGDDYSYSNWDPFLVARANDSPTITAFTKCFVAWHKKPGAHAVLEGNHFQLAAMTLMIEKSVVPCFDETARLFLDVPPDLVYRQRKDRNWPYDRLVTAEDVESQTTKMRAAAAAQGFATVLTPALVASIRRFFEGGSHAE